MADIEKLYAEVGKLMTDYKKVYEEAVRDQYITDSEFKELGSYLEWLTHKRAELTIAVEIKKNPRLNKQQVLAAIGDTLYKEAIKKHKKAMEAFEALKKDPNYHLVREWELRVNDYKLDEKGFLSLMMVETGSYYGNDAAKMMIANWAEDLKRKENEFVKAEEEVKKITKLLRLEIEARSETKSDEDAVKTADFKKTKELYRNLLDRMQTTMLNITTHFVGWMKASEMVCLSHRKAEAKFEELMAKQKEEIDEVGQYKTVASSIALTLAGVIFPGISTPFKTILTTVISPAVDKKVTEYKEVTATISGKVKTIKIGEQVDKKKSPEYAAAITAISADLLKAAKLSLNISEGTKISVAPAENSIEALSKYHLKIHEMIHSAATQCVHVLNILQDIDTRLTRMNEDLFEDEHVDSSEVLDGLKDLFKKLSASVNGLAKAKEGLKPPAIATAKSGDNDVFNQFLNVMLLKWVPSLEEYKTKTVQVRQRVGASGMRFGTKTVGYYDYVPVIDGVVQDAIKKYCGITINNVPREAGIGVTWEDWTGTADEADLGIKSLITSANAKFKGMENTNVWSKAMGL